MGEVLPFPPGVLASASLDAEVPSWGGGVLPLSPPAARSRDCGRGDLARVSSWLESFLSAL